MRRVIRNIKTREFFRAGAWTPDVAAAQDFPDTHELLVTCARYDLKDVELIIHTGYEGPGCGEVMVPLPDPFSEAAPASPPLARS